MTHNKQIGKAGRESIPNAEVVGAPKESVIKAPNEGLMAV